MNRLLVAFLVIVGLSLATYFLASNAAKGHSRPSDTRPPSSVTRCLEASFNSKVICLHGSPESLLHDLDELGDTSSRRSYVLLLESNAGVDAWYVSKESDAFSVLKFGGTFKPNLLARLENELLAASGLACAGELSHNILSDELPLVDKAVFHVAPSHRAILKHALRQRGKQFCRLVILKLC